MKPTTCQMDPCNTKFLLKFMDTILDTLTKIVNLSIRQGIFLPEWKLATVQPLKIQHLYKTTDPLELSLLSQSS